MRKILSILCVVLPACALVTGGCSSASHPPSPDYKTLAKDLHRDTDKAKQATNQAVALMKQDKYAEAESLLQDALNADVTYGPAHNNLGVVYYHESKFYQAAWEFQYAAKLMPDQPEPCNNLGLVLEAAGKLQEAVTSYDEAVKMAPNNPQYVGNDARARFRRGDRDAKEKELLQRLITIDTRPVWSAWAREKLELMVASSATKP
jgi:Flp pilus assembly protein TadD